MSHCQCGYIILADTENWKTPLCVECWIALGKPDTDPELTASQGNKS